MLINDIIKDKGKATMTQRGTEKYIIKNCPIRKNISVTRKPVIIPAEIRAVVIK